MHKALYVPVRSHTDLVFRPEDYRDLTSEFTVTENALERSMTAEEIAAAVGGHEALITGWGSPRLTEAVFEAAESLSLIAHTAGTVRAILSDEVIENRVIPRGIAVFSGNGAIALNVAESTIGLLLMTCRRWVDQVESVRSGGWHAEGVRTSGQFLAGATVGVISASKVGVEAIRLLRAFGTRILLYDPCIDDARAAELGVERVELDDLFARADMVTVHAPSLRATDHLIGERQLHLLRDGATLVNTARGSVIDEEALIAECRRREIYVALDVTDPEPPAADSELRHLPHVYITPHISGAGHYGYFRIGSGALQALRDHFAGRPAEGLVDFSRFAEIA